MNVGPMEQLPSMDVSGESFKLDSRRQKKGDAKALDGERREETGGMPMKPSGGGLFDGTQWRR